MSIGLYKDWQLIGDKLKFLDLSGYMFSGKAAISDLISEHNGFYVPNYRSEFDLIRIPHGLMDLKRALVDEWSWVRSDKAIREFVQLTEVLGRTPSSFLEKLFKPGFSYSKNYEGFNEKTMKFIDSLTEKSWRMRWPYELCSLSSIQHAKLKIVSKLNGRHAWPEIQYRLASGNEFLDKAKCYLRNLLVVESKADGCHTVVTHNMLEPYNPAAGFCFFDEIKSIVVDRDVRDIYMTATTHSDGFNDIVPLYSRIIGAFDVNIFIERQKILRSKTNYSTHPNVLRFEFENLVHSYEHSCQELRAFLGVSESDHERKKKCFDPERSAGNVGLWRNANRDQRKAIDRLEKELPDLCRQ